MASTPPVTTRDEFLRLWRKAVEQAVRNRRHLLLAVDGLDEDFLPPGSPSVASLLPTLVGEHAHVLVTSRLRPELPRDVEGGHPLRHVEPVRLSPFEGAERLAELARKEFYDLTHGVEADLAVDLLGLLTAAAGPLMVADLLALLSDGTGATGATARQVKVFVAERAVRILEPVGPAGEARWQFAHGSLLEYAQDPNGDFARDTEELRDPRYRQRIHRWAQHWRDAGWTTTADGGVPRYLLDEYPATLAGDPDRLAKLAGDPAWIAAAIPMVGVDRVLVTLRRAIAARPDHSATAAMLSVATGQRFNLLFPRPGDQLGYVLRQLCLEAMEHGEERLADMLGAQLRTLPDPGPIPLWTSYRASRALALELDEHDSQVLAMAVLGDGRMIICRDGGPVRVWDPDRPEAGPVQLGEDGSRAVAVLDDGRVVTGDRAGRVLMWDLDRPDAGPVQLGEHADEVSAVAVLGDGRVVTGDGAGRLLMWDPTGPDTGPVPIGKHPGHGGVRAVSVLDDGRVVTRGSGRVLIWDPTRPDPRPVRVGEHVDWVEAVAVLDDGRVVTGDRAGRLLMWDPTRPEAGPVQLGGHDGGLTAVAVLNDGRVVTAGSDGRLLMWDPDRPDVGPVPLAEHDGWATLVAVLGDGRVVTGDGAGRVLMWDPTRPDAGPTRIGEHAQGVEAVAMLGDGRVVTGGGGGQVLMWDPTRPDTGPARRRGPASRAGADHPRHGRDLPAGDPGHVLQPVAAPDGHRQATMTGQTRAWPGLRRQALQRQLITIHPRRVDHRRSDRRDRLPESMRRGAAAPRHG